MVARRLLTNTRAHVQVSIELVKVVMQLPRESLKNCFLSLALPSVVFSEPAAAQSTAINDTLSFTLWDKGEVRGHKTFKLQDFLKAIKVLYNISHGWSMGSTGLSGTLGDILMSVFSLLLIDRTATRLSLAWW